MDQPDVWHDALGDESEMAMEFWARTPDIPRQSPKGSLNENLRNSSS